MQDVRKADPSFTKFVPRSAIEAVDRFVRCRKNGLKPMLVPECLIECAKGLSEPELGKFEDWIINPNGSLDGVKLVPCDKIAHENESVYIENCKKYEELLSPVRGLRLVPAPDPASLPPVPDEKEMEEEQPDSSDEIMHQVMEM